MSATTSTTQDGTVLRPFMKDQFLYTSTFLKGLEVIDLQQAVAEYQSVFSSDPTQFGQAVSTEGNGFATDQPYSVVFPAWTQVGTSLCPSLIGCN